jgi:predicted secreted hydrolase
VRRGRDRPFDRRRRSRGATAAAALAALAAAVAALTAGAPGRPPSPRGGLARAHEGTWLELPSGGGESASFERASRVRPFRLPADHGPHFRFQTEWWYYTGNLVATDGRSFGFQLTFFRRGLSPGAPPDGPGLATNQVYFAHFAITDVTGRRHEFAERWARGAAGLAGATGEPFAVWLESWRVDSLKPDGSAVRLVARDGPLHLELDLDATKPLVAHGDRGLSAKGDEPGNASYYVGYTRLRARGHLAVGGSDVAVAGEAWFDHEWSTSALDPGAVGWDWFSLQLADGRELMCFRIRREDGSFEPASSGTLVEADGRSDRLLASAVSLRVLDHWTSPETGATYPSRWQLRVPGESLDLLVVPRVADQEMRTSFTYWEGAVAVSGTASGHPVSGQGYVELTGYARSMQGVF